jgi:hypothetical protein
VKCLVSPFESLTLSLSTVIPTVEVGFRMATPRYRWAMDRRDRRALPLAIGALVGVLAMGVYGGLYKGRTGLEFSMAEVYLQWLLGLAAAFLVAVASWLVLRRDS